MSLTKKHLAIIAVTAFALAGAYNYSIIIRADALPKVVGYIYNTRIGVTNQDCKPLYPRSTAVYFVSASGGYGAKGCMENVNGKIQAITWLPPSRMPVRMVQNTMIQTDAAGIASLFKPKIDFKRVGVDPFDGKPIDWSILKPANQ